MNKLYKRKIRKIQFKLIFQKWFDFTEKQSNILALNGYKISNKSSGRSKSIPGLLNSLREFQMASDVAHGSRAKLYDDDSYVYMWK